MATITRKCWLTYEGGSQNQPKLWEMSRRFPEVVFDIRQASVEGDTGRMAVYFEGDEDELAEALQHLITGGVRVQPVEAGSLIGP